MSSIFPELQTPRIKLRELTEKDADVLFAMHSNYSIMQWYGTDHMTQREDALALITTFANLRKLPSPGIRWGLCTHESNTLLGTCGFHRWNKEWNSCTIRYDLKVEARGKGYMQEALRCAIVWAFANMNLNRIEAQIHPNNRASILLVEKLGFVREGLARKAGYWGEQYYDLCFYSLLKSEFYG
ncbi:GNAT family N-acetyltransferase [Solimicrobium silvestre]|uniref:Acetyltransferase including N-acetylases of ribosomal protein n=1 Tax=Solimicrobium silvestre TaxID=2099400 RepID=A0A2S9H2K0_9BURK|nr:GNAT family protein [Solimicrobium silvestre]PRC94173.1 Acetyltransferase including N-acetylases of ribosomal protein [Solimicrobium silvestre]